MNHPGFKVFVAAIAILATSGAAAAAPLVPFKGTLSGAFTRTGVNPPFVDVMLVATGNATQIGRFALVFPHRVNVSTVPPSVFGRFTFTAANGDLLFADVIGQAAPVTPTLLRIVEIGTIQGGTGRFAGANGQFTTERLIDQVALTTIGSFAGTISSVGATKH